MKITAIFELSTIDLQGEPLLSSASERPLAVGNYDLINIPEA